MSYIAPPKSLYLTMHYFNPILGDTTLPPSLTSVLAGLRSNEYLVRCNIADSITYMSAFVYNPGTGNPESYYDCYNAVAGDWVANSSIGYTWKITQIYNVTSDPNGNITNGSTFYAKILDVDQYNAGIDPIGTFNGSPDKVDSNTILFTVDEDGFPIFSPSDTFNISVNFSGNVIGRFRALNTYNQYVSILQTDASGAFAVGDPVCINPATNLFQPSYGLGDISGVYETIGIVTSVGVPDKDHFTFNPFGEYRSLGDALTGPAGTVYYINPTGATGTDAYTTSRPAGNPYPVYQTIDTSGNVILLKGQGFSAGGGGGGQGPTGPTGPTVAYIFDGGNAASVYTLGPAFDCGSAN
jgi:hypothetical protein